VRRYGRYLSRGSFGLLLLVTQGCTSATRASDHGGTSTPTQTSSAPSSASPTTRSASPSVVTSLPACEGSQYAYEPGKSGTSGAMILVPYIRYITGPKCRVSDRVTLLLTDGRGHLVSVDGDPASMVVTATIGPLGVNPQSTLMAWRNWCSQSPAKFGLTMASATHRATVYWSVGTPACLDSSKPSYLTRFTSSGFKS
jgi:hypothetical protein